MAPLAHAEEITMPFGSTARAHSSMVQCMTLNGPETLPAAPSSLPLIGLFTGKYCGSPATALAAPDACLAAKRVMTRLQGNPCRAAAAWGTDGGTPPATIHPARR